MRCKGRNVEWRMRVRSCLVAAEGAACHNVWQDRQHDESKGDPYEVCPISIWSSLTHGADLHNDGPAVTWIPRLAPYCTFTFLSQASLAMSAVQRAAPLLISRYSSKGLIVPLT